MDFIFNRWYPLCLFEELEQRNPLPKKILDKDLLVFKTESGQYSVIEDRCCHRNVNLSLGYIKGEHVKCAYHGWEFATDGSCAHIPSLPPDKRIPNTCKVDSYFFRTDYNIIWVWLGDEELKDSVDIPPMPEMNNLPRVYNYHTFKADLKPVAESLIDAYHINHVHRNSIQGIMGELHDEQVDFNIQKGKDWLTGTYLRKNEGSIFEKFYFGFQPYITTHFGFWFPHTSKLDIRFVNRKMVIYEFFYPIDKETLSMCQITLWENIFSMVPPFAKWFMLQKSIKIVEEDLVFLENSKMVKKKYQKPDLLVTPSDEVSFEFAKIWTVNTRKENES